MVKKIIFSSGGTGGHIFPAVNLMKHFHQKGFEVLLVTDKRGNAFLKKNTKFKSIVITASTPTDKNSFRKFFSFIFIFLSIIKSLIILAKEKPNLVFGLGGYVSFPICFASRFFKIPIFIYENNLILGRANNILLSSSKKVFIGLNIPNNFPKKYVSKIYKVGNILSNEIINNTKVNTKNLKDCISILVLGGSQGAEIFGKIIPPTIKMICDKGYKVEVIQQCIDSQKESIIEFYKKNNIKSKVFTFTNDILSLITSSNFAITRCGASTIAELAHTQIPFVAVPLSNSIDNHQYLNAKYYEDNGSCWIMEQINFNSINLLNLVIKIIKDEKKINSIREIKKNETDNVYLKIENAIKEYVQL